jgi:hypothetical protein
MLWGSPFATFGRIRDHAAVLLVIVVGMVRMIGSNASTIFSQVGSAIQ